MKSPLGHRTRFERACCAAGALLCYAAAALSAPSGARSQLAPAPIASTAPESVSDNSIAPIVPAHDAFAPRVTIAADAPVAAPVRVLPAPPPAARAVPQAAIRPAARARVTAIATGQTPSAIVDVGGAAQTLGIGDRIGGAHIVAIGTDAIVLDDGSVLRLAPGAP